MSTLKENLTSVEKTSGSTTNNITYNKEENFSSSESFYHCGKNSGKNSEKENPNFFCASSSDVEPKFKRLDTFGDLLNAAERLDQTEELDTKIGGNEEPLEDFDDKAILDIKPIVLQKEHFSDIKNLDWQNVATKNSLNTKKAVAKKRFSDFFKSLCVLCDICDDRRTERVIKLNRLEKIVGAVLLKKTSGFGVKTEKIFTTKIPEQSCHRCFTKIILLYNRHKNRNAHQRKIKKETKEIMDEPSHGYDCQCVPCQSQYGDLPVLLKGIEEQHKLQNSQLQVNFRPEENQDISQSRHAIHLPEPINTVHGQNQDQASFQQYPDKFQEDYYMSHSTMSSYNQVPMDENQMDVNFRPTTKTEGFLDPDPASFDHHRLTVRDQSHYDINFQSQSRYYASEANTSSALSLVETSSSQEQHLPTLLQEIEDKCQTELSSQPSTSSGIKSEYQTHTPNEKQSKKTMICVHCDKNFSHKGDFNKHLRKHTKEKPYKCCFCDKTFSHTSNLHRHQRIHSGDRPFRCEYCDKCFNRKDKLESHKNSKFCKNRRSWK